jgi:cytochrome oxidase Cu insertion factor (SCO1/SenC/PrrC family)
MPNEKLCKGAQPLKIRNIALKISRLTLLAAVTLVAPLLFALQSVAAQTASAEKGPPVGQKIPVFEARDQFGREQTLASLTGPKGLVLLFFRSADW